MRGQGDRLPARNLVKKHGILPGPTQKWSGLPRGDPKIEVGKKNLRHFFPWTDLKEPDGTSPGCPAGPIQPPPRGGSTTSKKKKPDWVVWKCSALFVPAPNLHLVPPKHFILKTRYLGPEPFYPTTAPNNCALIFLLKSQLQT